MKNFLPSIYIYIYMLCVVDETL